MDDGHDSNRAASPGGVANTLSGFVAGTSLQAGEVHGGVHIHAAPATARRPVPRQLPPAPAGFTGRKAELARLDQMELATGRKGSSALVVLTGPGGVGKTALAVHWAHQVRDRFPDGQLYIDLAGFGGGAPVDPGEALGQFLRALGVPPQGVPVGLAEQAALFRSLTAEQAVLVLLDNALSPAQTRVLFPASGRALVLVTSRSRLVGLASDGATAVSIPPLDTTDAVTLLARTVSDGRIASESEHATSLVRLCGCLPIAVRLAATRLAARPRWSVERVLSELLDERARLSVLSGSDDTSLRALFDLMYQQLSPAAARLYRRLGLHPGREFDPGVCSAVLGGPPSQAEEVLYELVDLNLVEETTEDRFRLHDLLRLHAGHRSDQDEPSPQRAAATRRIFEWYLAAAMGADLVLTPYRRRHPYRFGESPDGLPTFVNREQALGWLEVERENLLAAGQASLQRGWFELAWQLADVMWPLLLYRKHYRDRIAIDERGVAAAREWRNPAAEADMRKRLGLVLRTLGRYDDAEAQLRASLSKWAETGDERGRAESQDALGVLYLATGRVDEAVELFEQVLAYHRAAADARGVGLALINLGLALPRLSRTADARQHLEEARTIFDELHDVDPYNGARTLVAMAQLQCTTGDVGGARELAASGLAQMSRLGSEFGAAEAHEVLAETELRAGDLASARRHLDCALSTFVALRSPRATELRSRLWSRIHGNHPGCRGPSEVASGSDLG